MSTAEAGVKISAARYRVLLVEDVEDVRAVVRAALEAEGYEVIEAADGISAVESALVERPDAIIMDMSLPRLDGYRATKLIRQEPALRGVPVVACTALNRWEWRGKSIAAGCDAFVTKPIDFAQLSAVLSQLLARRRAS
jgi:two-component system cell cycle response regulator DivK